MKLTEYKDVVAQCGHFTVGLGDSRADDVLQPEKVRDIVVRWIDPLLKQSVAVYLYRNQYLTAPPKGVRPVILSRTNTRLEVNGAKMVGEKYWEYWTWALSTRNIGIVLDANVSLIPELAKRSWDPCIITNLGVVVPRALIAFARRKAEKNKMVWLFSRNSINVYAHAFAPRQHLLNLYETFVQHCRFNMKGLERELKGA